jgi:hypothetical protein
LCKRTILSDKWGLGTGQGVGNKQCGADKVVKVTGFYPKILFAFYAFQPILLLI